MKKINLDLIIKKDELRQKLGIKDPDTSLVVKSKLESLKEGEKLSINAIEKLREILDELYRKFKEEVVTSTKGGIRAGSARIKKFLGLEDTPNSYIGQGGKIVSIRSDEKGLEFINPSSGSGDMTKAVYDPGGGERQVAFQDELPNLSNYELKANKVTSISSSSTDIQYPSAKLVYNQLELKASKNFAVAMAIALS
jgi:hypothetical protein